MSFLQKVHPEWVLRITLGLTYLYSGQDLIRHPTAWVWALPYWLRQGIAAIIPLNTYLQIQGIIEILFAIVLLSWFLRTAIVRAVALFSVLEFGAILILAFFPWSEPNFSITFRDIGLLGAALALYGLLSNNSSAAISHG